MTIAAPREKIYTPEEYLALEIESEVRSEFRDGEIVEMTGGTPEHNKIVSAFNALLWFSLRGKPLSLFVTDQRLWIPAKNLHTYPDVMVIADPLALQAGRTDTVMNPALIAEVLSDSTKAYDRGDKFAAYRTISTFTEYLLVDQYQPRVEQYVRQAENQWLLTVHEGLEVKVNLESVSVEIALAELYENVDFGAEKDAEKL